MLARFGGLTLPAVADEDTGTLASLDPARDQLLAFFESVINSEFAEAWATAAAALPTGHPFSDLATPIADTFPDEPIQQVLTQRSTRFPLLALHRSGAATFEDFVLDRDKLTQPWTLHYILGPLDVIDQRRFKDLCQAIPKTLRMALRQRKHLSYQDGALQFFGNTSSFASIDLVSYAAGNAVFADGDNAVRYYATEMALQTTELSDHIEGSDETTLEGADLRLHLGNDDGLLPDAVLWSSDAPPGDEPNPQ